MALPEQRIHAGGDSPYEHEREALAYVLGLLPDRDPLQAWPLQELLDRSTGDLLEIDLIVLGPHALYLVEIKSYPDGKLAGDAADWRWQPGGQSDWRYYPHPFKGANRKAKILKGLLGRDRDLRDLRVEALVFVSSRGLDTTRLDKGGRNHVAFRRDIGAALLEARFDGANPALAQRSIDRATARKIVKQLSGIGLRARRGGQMFGSWELHGEIASGPGWQEYFGQHATLDRNQESGQARVRVYRRPAHEAGAGAGGGAGDRAAPGDRTRDRDRLRQIAQREFQSLYQLQDCPQVLRAREFCENATTHDPAIVFEPFSGAAPFSSFLRLKPDLSFDDRLLVVTQVAHVLHACHKKEVLHRGLHPGCVLVRETAAGLEVRLAGFQHARDFDNATLQTLHSTELAAPDFLLYRAPELLFGHESGSPEADVFSLAALAFFAFTGQPPAADPDELVATIREQGGLRPGLLQDDLTLLDPVFLAATDGRAIHRPGPIEFLNALEERLTLPDEERDVVGPQEARPGQRLQDGFIVVRELGRGSSARVLEVQCPRPAPGGGGSAGLAALKVPLDDARQEALGREAALLETLKHPGVVPLLAVVRPSGVTCLLLGLADADTLGHRLRQQGPLSLDLARRYGRNLLDTLAYLELSGITHRDIKPHNLGFTREGGKKASQLLLFDFSLSALPAQNVQVGTVAYRDPWLASRKAWDAAADRFAAALTLHEMLTGVRPDYGERIHPAAVRDARLRLDPTRFDGALRQGMVAFFEQALAPDLADRFASAEDMQYAWERVFREPGVVGTSTGSDTGVTSATGVDSNSGGGEGGRQDAGGRDAGRGEAEAEEVEEGVEAAAAGGSEGQGEGGGDGGGDEGGEGAGSEGDGEGEGEGKEAGAAAGEAAALPAFTLDEALAQDTPLAAFVRSPLLLDALERSGALTALDVARLPQNRLSAVPGVGKETQGQVLDLITALRAHFAALLAAETPLLPDFHLAPEALLDLPRDLLQKDVLHALHEAGIRTTTELAQSSPAHLDKLLRSFDLDASSVRRSLAAYQEQAAEQGAAPATLAGWCELLLAAGRLEPKRSADGGLRLTKTKRAGHAWLGLPGDDAAANARLGQRDQDPVVGFARTETIAEVLGVSQPTVGNAIGAARDHWQAHPHKEAFGTLVRGALAALGGAAPLHHAAERLRRTLALGEDPVPARAANGAGSGTGTGSATATSTSTSISTGATATPVDPARANDAARSADRRRAAALLRIASLLTDAEGQPFLMLGVHGDAGASASSATSTAPATWCALEQGLLEAARVLGLTADALIAGDPGSPAPHLPSFEAARRNLETAAAPFWTEVPAPQLLFPLAAHGSRSVACSRKLELYPRGLDARSALNLARAAVLAALPARRGGTLSAEELRTLVADRYPDAEPLPERPALDALVQELGLIWRPELEGGYGRRPDEEPTAAPTLERLRRARSSSGAAGARSVPSARELRARRFEDALRLSLEKRAFRLIQCLDTEYEDAIAALAGLLEVEPISFDRLLLDQMDRLMASHGIDPAVVYTADRAGPPGEGLGPAAVLPAGTGSSSRVNGNGNGHTRADDPAAGPDPTGIPATTSGWQNLCRLAAEAAELLHPELSADPEQPRLVIHLGLIARYGLTRFLDRWLRACEQGEGHAVFALVPSEQNDDPTINDRMPVPLSSVGSQRLWMDADWLERRCRRPVPDDVSD